MFQPGKTQQVTDHISMLRTFLSNFYLYRSDDGYLAFDCGMGGVLAKAAFRRLGVDPAEVRAVFLTHSDFDHRGGLGLFPHADVYLSAAEVPMITREKARKLFLYNAGIRRYTPLADGETVTIGGASVRLIASPGHTVGSACYRIGSDAIATGDLLLVQNGRVDQFSVVQNMNHAENRTTLTRLISEGAFSGVDYLLTGHSGAKRIHELTFLAM